jgi:uncharacterized protein (UPF0332 family)
MAIINTLDKCLDSPYLVRDPEAPARVDSLLRLAADRLEQASALHHAPKSDPADTAMLAYESMFAAIRALVYARGYRESSLRCLLVALEHEYVAPGRLDPALVHAFHQAQTLELPPAQVLASSGALLARAREILTPS